MKGCRRAVWWWLGVATTGTDKGSVPESRHPILVRMLGAVFLASLMVGTVRAQNKEVFGWVERVQIREADLTMLAKLDTGADTSSIHANEVTEFEKDGVRWVQFEVRNFQGKVGEIKAPVVRVTKIKRHSGVPQRRVVIKLGLCLGEMFQEEYVSIVDRSQFDYQFLLGRSFLAGNAIVDAASMYTSSPNCRKLSKKAEASSSSGDAKYNTEVAPLSGKEEGTAKKGEGGEMGATGKASK